MLETTLITIKVFVAEFFKIISVQAFVWVIVSGMTIGTSAYQIVNPEPKAYKESSIRATTFTGRGQFKCQIGC
jgi:hypothetical protein